MGRINGEEMEEVNAFKYLGAWFDRRMRGNVSTAGENDREGRGMGWKGGVDVQEGRSG